MHSGRKLLRQCQAHGMLQLLCEGEGFGTPLEGLVRKAQRPQDKCEIESAHHPDIKSSHLDAPGMVPLGVIGDDNLLEVRTRSREFSEEEQSIRQYMGSGYLHESTVILVLGQVGKLLRELKRRLQL